MTVRVNDAFDVLLPTVSDQAPGVGLERQHHRARIQPEGPGGLQATGVRGRQLELEVGRVLVVGRGERAAGDPGNDWMVWEWQFDGQCCMTSSHDSAEGGRLPSWVSTAEPENVMTSPTRHVVPAAGALIVAVGAVLPTTMTTVSVAVGRGVGHAQRRRVGA